MPRKTSGGLVAVIVYLDQEEADLLAAEAREQDRSVSALVRRILAERRAGGPDWRAGIASC